MNPVSNHTLVDLGRDGHLHRRTGRVHAEHRGVSRPPHRGLRLDETAGPRVRTALQDACAGGNVELVRLLLDTHAFIWWVEDDPALGLAARAAIDLQTNPVYVSAASAWEIAIKRAKGTLDAPSGDVAEWIAREGFQELEIAVRHGTAAGALPLHHRDPFDRVLVAQARLEDMSLVTADPAIAAYDVSIIAAAG